LETLAVIASVIVAIVLLSWYSKRKMAQSWSGVVTELQRYQQPQDATDSQSMMVEWLRVAIRTDAGKTLKLRWARSQFDQLFPDGLVEGDRVEKAAGALNPGKVALGAHR